MIKAYHRPESLADALALLSRAEPLTLPLGGGTVLSQQRSKSDFEVVDLQRLGLNAIVQEGQLLVIGATVTLQQLLETNSLPDELAQALRESLRHEAGQNMRQTATLAGTLVSCDGRSPFVTALLALDPRLAWATTTPALMTPSASAEEEAPEPDPLPVGETMTSLGDYLPLREPFGMGKLILNARIPLNARLRFAMVARSPMDLPIVCAAVASWPSGRTRVTLGGFGRAPILAMDGPEPIGAAMAAREAYRFAGDEWASADYRMDVAGKLVARILSESQPVNQIANESR